MFQFAEKQKNAGEDEKERLLKEHQDNMRTIDDNLKKQQDRTKEMLREKLAARRNKLKMGGVGGATEDQEKKKAEELEKLKEDKQTIPYPFLEQGTINYIKD